MGGCFLTVQTETINAKRGPPRTYNATRSPSRGRQRFFTRTDETWEGEDACRSTNNEPCDEEVFSAYGGSVETKRQVRAGLARAMRGQY